MSRADPCQGLCSPFKQLWLSSRALRPHCNAPCNAHQRHLPEHLFQQVSTRSVSVSVPHMEVACMWLSADSCV